ncbi:MAG: hypothetical protein ACE5Q3_04460 [Alphaproteobacteria bacterium]
MRHLIFPMLAAAAFLLATASTSAGEINYTGGQSVWAPTDCSLGPAPTIDPTDATSLNESILRFNAYVAEVERYNACVAAEAERDMSTIVTSIADTAGELQNEALQSIESLRASLGGQRDQ